MTSRLDPFFHLVFDQLNSQGSSYQSVCASLLEEGVTISPQALRSWHLRRGRKIAARSLQTQAPVTAPAPGAAPACASLDRTVAMREQVLAAPVTQAKPAITSAGLTPLLAQIEEEERRLVLQTTHQNFFPVRRKPIIDSSEPPSSTTATPQTQKGNQ